MCAGKTLDRSEVGTVMRMNELSEHTGTEVLDLDLREPLGTDARMSLSAEFAQRSVLVFRDQMLSAHDVLNAVQEFGKIFEQHNTRFQLPECPQIHYLSNQDRYPDGSRYIPGAGYHTDHSNAEAPPKATVLYAVSLPSQGGDPQYVNMHSAYEALPRATRERIADLRAIHVYQSHLSKRKLMGLTATRQSEIPDAVSHPLVRTHPETGRKALYLNPIRIERIEGMSEAQTVALLDELLEHVTQPAFEYRHRWRLGDLVMWDNRCLLHKANGDYDMNERRYLYRVMLEGDRPI
jgi:taurine dioxygenase